MIKTCQLLRIKDGAIVLPVTFPIAVMFQHYLTKTDERIKPGIVSLDNNKVKLTSKGTCHFQVIFLIKIFYKFDNKAIKNKIYELQNFSNIY